MFCPNCGTKNDDNAAFCSNCGTPLKGQATGSTGATGGGTSSASNMGNPTPTGIPPKNWMTEAILATVFGFLCSCLGGIFGIVAIVNANNVNKRFQLGDVDGAEKAAKDAKLWSMISAGITVVIFILWILINGATYMALMQGSY